MYLSSIFPVIAVLFLFLLYQLIRKICLNTSRGSPLKYSQYLKSLSIPTVLLKLVKLRIFSYYFKATIFKLSLFGKIFLF